MQGYEPEHYLYIDIETLPEGEPDFELLKTEEELKKEAPKSYSKVKQEEWVVKKLESQVEDMNKEFRKGSLESLKGRIFCIAVAYDNNPIHVIEYNVDEKVILCEFEKWIRDNIPEREIYITKFVGKNVKKFDLRWIFHRALRYNRKDLINWLPIGKYDKRIEDIGDLFDMYSYGVYTKLDDMAKYLGLDGKGDIDGSQVYDYFLDNRYNEIHEYCADDVDQTRKIHYRLKGIEIKED